MVSPSPPPPAPPTAGQTQVPLWSRATGTSVRDTDPDVELCIRVAGRPAPQGSKNPLPNGRMKESSAWLRPWRDAVGWAAWERLRELGHTPATWVPLTGALVLEATFSLQRPARPKAARPIVPPDLSKLLRATEDALTDARVWKDDALVVTAIVHKAYACEGRSPVIADTLDLPGAVIRIRRVDRQALLPPTPAQLPGPGAGQRPGEALPNHARAGHAPTREGPRMTGAPSHAPPTRPAPQPGAQPQHQQLDPLDRTTARS
ncbi:RusA family crossover junction endodeoxyribonuclease [Kineococcus gynurae]|uniref:RusA family crossover junction endodeoxyribonuclease n=1 Tax=Kineococcus gynurae TaxID=452979 RepID=A0ABV5LWW0_9ACTN